jgi:hypothetical protein
LLLLLLLLLLQLQRPLQQMQLQPFTPGIHAKREIARPKVRTS